jgi:hypothetical protein
MFVMLTPISHLYEHPDQHGHKHLKKAFLAAMSIKRGLFQLGSALRMIACVPNENIYLAQINM